MKRSVRAAAAIVATGLVLVACGSADDATPAAEPVADTAAPQADADPSLDAGAATDTTAAAPADAGPDAAEPADDTAVTSDLPAANDEAPSEEPAAAEAVIGGRAFAAELSAESDFAENLLPDLLVDDIRSGQQINFRNIFPAERPVLIWAWAPH